MEYTLTDEDLKRKDEEWVKFVAEARSMFNDICILGDDEVVRLIGIEDGGDDYYYIIRKLHGERVHHSCCGGIVSLRGIYPRYEYQDQMFAMNLCPKEPEMIVMRKDLISRCSTCKHIDYRY